MCRGKELVVVLPQVPRALSQILEAPCRWVAARPAGTDRRALLAANGKAMGGVQQGELGLASFASKPHALSHRSIHGREIYPWRAETDLIRNLRAAQLALEIYPRKSTIWVLEREA